MGERNTCEALCPGAAKENKCDIVSFLPASYDVPPPSLLSVGFFVSPPEANRELSLRRTPSITRALVTTEPNPASSTTPPRFTPSSAKRLSSSAPRGALATPLSSPSAKPISRPNAALSMPRSSPPTMRIPVLLRNPALPRPPPPIRAAAATDPKTPRAVITRKVLPPVSLLVPVLSPLPSECSPSFSRHLTRN